MWTDCRPRDSVHRAVCSIGQFVQPSGQVDRRPSGEPWAGATQRLVAPPVSFRDTAAASPSAHGPCSRPGVQDHVGVPRESLDTAENLPNEAPRQVPLGWYLSARCLNRPGFPGGSIPWEDRSHGQTQPVLSGSAGACRPDGVRARPAFPARTTIAPAPGSRGGNGLHPTCPVWAATDGPEKTNRGASSPPDRMVSREGIEPSTY